jgi:hypothetical protein
MKWLKALPIVLLLIGPAAAQVQVVLFQTEQTAQQHCPSDQVVWANLPTHIYHLRGQRWYGRTKSGAYVCEKEAEANGYRMTRNGQ